jgi:hypothetical protein
MLRTCFGETTPEQAGSVRRVPSVRPVPCGSCTGGYDRDALSSEELLGGSEPWEVGEDSSYIERVASSSSCSWPTCSAESYRGERVGKPLS